MSKLKLYNYWYSNFEKSGIKSEFVEKYMAYVSKLLNNNVPIIFDFNHLCLLLGRNGHYLASVVIQMYHIIEYFKFPNVLAGIEISQHHIPLYLNANLGYMKIF